MSSTPTFVYVIALDGLDGYCKVGVAISLEHRLSGLSTGTPFKPFVAHSIKMKTNSGAYALESKAHRALKESRVNGEWFNVSTTIAWDTIQELADRRSIWTEPVYSTEYVPAFKITHKVFTDPNKFIIPKTPEECGIVAAQIRARLKAKESLQTQNRPPTQTQT